MTEEGFLRACLPAVGGVEVLFLASFSSCNFEMAEGFSRAFLPSGVSLGAITKVLAQMYLQLSSKCRRQIYQHLPTHHSG
jgi:hypothetical protein